MKIKPNKRAGLLRKPYHIALGCLLVVAAGLQAQEAARTSGRVPRMRAYVLDNAPRIDYGLIDDEWMSIEPASGFIQQLPDEGQPASERTGFP